VSRIETGEVLATLRDIRDLGGLYQADPAERDSLVAAARSARVARAAWTRQHRHEPNGRNQDGDW
jgi:hypothetical protein